MRGIAAIAGLVMSTGCSPVLIAFPDDSGLEADACAVAYYPDADADGYGAANAEPVLACAAPEGTSTLANDCDDGDPAIQPGAVERCDGLDNDCDGQTDEGAAAPSTWYADADGDGYGDRTNPRVACEAPVGEGPGWVADSMDCDDDDDTVHPGAVERCDGQDQDCDGAVDESCTACDLTVPDGFASIQEAIDTASVGAVICVGPGTWVGPLDLGAKDLTLMSVQGASATVLDAAGAGSVVRAGGGHLTLIGFTLTGGLAERGGGVEVRGGEATLSDLSITDCAAGEGGAVYLDGAQASLLGLRIEDCAAESGGGIAILDGETHIARVNITGTRATHGYGGGIAAERAVLEIEALTVSQAEATGGGGLALISSLTAAHAVVLRGCVATADGGGGLMLAEGVLTAEELRLEGDEASDGSGGGVRMKGGRLVGTRLRFIDDIAAGDGGGLRLESGEAELSWVAFEGDEAGMEGGAISLVGEASLRLTQAVMVGSRAQGGGALRASDNAEVFLDHVLVSSNRATTGPGGAFAVSHNASLVVSSAIFTDNQALHGAALSLGDTAQLRLTDASLHANRGGPSLQADGASSARLVLAGASLSGCAPWPAISANAALSYDLDWINVYGAGTRPISGLGAHGQLGTLLQVSPGFMDTASTSPLFWDLHLSLGSGLLDAGNPALADPDGSQEDLGAWGTLEAATWDLDGDGAPSWWQPGAYDGGSYPTQGWDCDDLDPTVFPGAGC